MSEVGTRHTGRARKWIPEADQLWFVEVYYPKFLSKQECAEQSNLNPKTLDKVLDNEPVSPVIIERIQNLRKNYTS